MQFNVTIAPRFCGPPDSGNGGYVCGLLAGFIEEPAQVILRKPPPLSRPLEVHVEGRSARLMDQDILIAEAGPGQLASEFPPPPSFEDSIAASKNFKAFEGHVFPTCFVCGPERNELDGMRIFAGSVTGKEIVASPWVPNASLADNDGIIREEFHWAALDCPGYFSISDTLRKSVLGKMTAQVFNRVEAGDKCIVIGWLIKNDGRKHFTGTAIYTEDGSLSALSNGVWIDID